MKKGMLVIFVVLFTVSMAYTAFGATFSYYSNYLFSKSDAKVSNDSETDDPEPLSVWNYLEVESVRDAKISNGDISAYGYGHGIAEPSENTLSIYMEDNVLGMSNDTNSYIEAHNSVSTRGFATPGIFFQITPENGTGENKGDPVQINLTWRGDLTTSEGTSGHLSGGGGGDAIAVTLNDCPSSKPLENVVWSHERINRSNGNDFHDSDNGHFMAVIGDIVGIHMDSNVNLYWNGEGYEIGASASQNLNMEVNAVPIPGAVWLLGSGLFGLVAVRRRRNKIS